MEQTLTGLGRIRRLDTNMFLAEVNCWIKILPSDKDNFGVWYGNYQLTENDDAKNYEFATVGTVLKLELEDGRNGEIVLTDFITSAENRLQVLFSGLGSLK